MQTLETEIKYTAIQMEYRKEWVLVVENCPVGTIREMLSQNGSQYGWRDKAGGHWFRTFDIAAKARIMKGRKIK